LAWLGLNADGGHGKQCCTRNSSSERRMSDALRCRLTPERPTMYRWPIVVLEHPSLSKGRPCPCARSVTLKSFKAAEDRTQHAFFADIYEKCEQKNESGQSI
jgi:hypothetical protein